MHDNQIHLLTKRRFLPLFVTQFCEGFNDNAYKFLLLAFISFQLNVSELEAQKLQAFASSLFALPYFIFSATAGQLADKYNKAYVVRIIKTLEVPIMIIAVYAVLIKSIPLMMSGLFLIACHSTFFGPLKLSILPSHLSKKELLGGNGLIEAGTFVAILSGALFGSAILSADRGFHYSALLLVGIAVFSCITSFLIPHTKRAAPNIRIDVNIFKASLSIVKQGCHDRTVLLAILGISWLWLSGTVLITEIPVYAKYVLKADQSVLALLFGLFTLGVAFGSLIVNHLLHGVISTRFVPITLVIASLFMWDLASVKTIDQHENLQTISHFIAHSSHWHVILDTFMIAAAYGVFLVPLYTLLQTKSKPDHIARTIAANRIFNAFFMFLGSSGLALVSILGIDTTGVLILLAFVNFLAALFFCKLLPKPLSESLMALVFRLVSPHQIRGKNHLKPKQLILVEKCDITYFDCVYLSVVLGRPIHRIAEESPPWYHRLFSSCLSLYRREDFPSNQQHKSALPPIVLFQGSLNSDEEARLSKFTQDKVLARLNLKWDKQPPNQKSKLKWLIYWRKQRKITLSSIAS